MRESERDERERERRRLEGDEFVRGESERYRKGETSLGSKRESRRKGWERERVEWSEREKESGRRRTCTETETFLWDLLLFFIKEIPWSPRLRTSDRRCDVIWLLRWLVSRAIAFLFFFWSAAEQSLAAGKFSNPGWVSCGVCSSGPLRFLTV